MWRQLCVNRKMDIDIIMLHNVQYNFRVHIVHCTLYTAFLRTYFTHEYYIICFWNFICSRNGERERENVGFLRVLRTSYDFSRYFPYDIFSLASIIKYKIEDGAFSHFFLHWSLNLPHSHFTYSRFSVLGSQFSFSVHYFPFLSFWIEFCCALRITHKA